MIINSDIYNFCDTIRNQPREQLPAFEIAQNIDLYVLSE